MDLFSVHHSCFSLQLKKLRPQLLDAPFFAVDGLMAHDSVHLKLLKKRHCVLTALHLLQTHMFFLTAL